MNENLFARFRPHMTAHPTAPFLETPRGARLSYADLDTATAKVARALADLGLRPDDRVAVHVGKSVEALLLYLGVLRAGCVYLPLNTGYTPAELSYFLEDAEPALVVCDPQEEAAIRALREPVETLGLHGEGTLWPKVTAAPAEFPEVVRAAGDLAAILYTSGTTGRSKGAMLTHENLASNAEALRDVWQFTRDDKLLHALPIFHTHGLFVATNTVLLAGASMIFLDRFDPTEVLACLPNASAMMGVPTFYARLLARPEFSAEAARTIRVFISGSAPLSAETHRAFQARTGQAILERYGMTETGMITSNPYTGERRAGTVGFPLPRVEVRIADRETSRLLPAGEVGGVEVRGPNVFTGYWRNPEKTAAEFCPDGFFVTGDLGMRDEEGRLTLVGRDKDLIISGGLNVYPAEIENALDALPGVAESAVIGLPHPDFGEGVTAVVAGRPGADITEAGLQRALAESLARFKLPKRVIFVDHLPRNSMGKVQKALLREQHAALYTGTGEL